jgi:hypothetical protein
VTGNFTRRSGGLVAFCANSVQITNEPPVFKGKVVPTTGLEPV